MAAVDAEMSLERRLRLRDFEYDAARDAINGKRLPWALGRPVTRLCIVRGIRYHPDFASGPASVLHGVLPLFTRALNARAIMSNQIPDHMDQDETPYCIWHPEVPTEETLRELVTRYPHMAYQAGRSAAVAGYAKLYCELDILPEVSIAEEARESGCTEIFEGIMSARGSGSTEIFERIMSAPVKFKVFDDYARTINTENPKPAFLNGDTAVRPLLDHKQGFSYPLGRMPGEEGDDVYNDDPYCEIRSLDDVGERPSSGFETTMYDITEDMNIATRSNDYTFELSEARIKANKDAERLLYEPLPLDLPMCDKDLLILMAAYHGNIDRYARLRRPQLIDYEWCCIVRGIYHNPMFARWWTTQPIPDGYTASIRRAIAARRIMSNDLSYLLTQAVSEDWRDEYFPNQIWYPSVALESTYAALAEAIPRMRIAAARAAIFADYQALFDKLIAAKTNDDDDDDDGSHSLAQLFAEARHSHNPHYRLVLEEIAKGRGISLNDDRLSNMWWNASVRQIRQSARIWSWGIGSNILMLFDESFAPYDGLACDASAAELYVLLPDNWTAEPPNADYDEFPESYVDLDYKDWPPNASALLSATKTRLAAPHPAKELVMLPGNGDGALQEK